MHTDLVRVLAVAAVCVAFAPVSRAAGGAADPAYGTAGEVDLPGNVLIPLPDGTLLGVKRPTADSDPSSVSHFDLNGMRDLGFGATGSRTLNVSLSVGLASATRTPDGKFYVWGSVPEMPPGSRRYDMAVVRLNGDGSLDASFGSAGLLSLRSPPNAGSVDRAEGLIVLADGSFLVSDDNYDDPYDYSISVTIRKFTRSGTADNSFGDGGAVTLPPAIADLHYLTPFDITDTGLIRFEGYDSTFAYLNPDGSAAPAPADYHALRSDVSHWVLAGQLAGGDSLLTGESAAGASVIARVHADGSMERSFGTAGTGFAEVPGTTLVDPAYSFQPAVLSGDAQHLYLWLAPTTGADGVTSLARLNVDGAAPGTLDTTFAPGGIAPITQPGFTPGDVVEQPSGAVLFTAYLGDAFRFLAGAAASAPPSTGSTSSPPTVVASPSATATTGGGGGSFGVGGLIALFAAVLARAMTAGQRERKPAW